MSFLKRNTVLSLWLVVFSIYTHAMSNQAGSIIINGIKCLEVSGSNIGDKLKAKDCQDNENQKFIIDRGLIKLKSDQQKCLSYMKNSDFGSNIFVWSCEQDNPTSSSEHLFFIDKNNIKLSNNKSCLTVNNNSDDIVADKCNDISMNKISFQSEIRLNNQCLHLDNDKNGTIVRVENCNNSVNQQFFIYGNVIKAALNINKCLDSFDSDIKMNKITQNSVIKLYINDCNSQNKYQEFVLVNNMLYRADSTGVCLSIFNGKKFDVNNPAVLIQCKK